MREVSNTGDVYTNFKFIYFKVVFHRYTKKRFNEKEDSWRYPKRIL